MLLIARLYYSMALAICLWNDKKADKGSFEKLKCERRSRSLSIYFCGKLSVRFHRKKSFINFEKGLFFPIISFLKISIIFFVKLNYHRLRSVHTLVIFNKKIHTLFLCLLLCFFVSCIILITIKFCITSTYSNSDLYAYYISWLFKCDEPTKNEQNSLLNSDISWIKYFY